LGYEQVEGSRGWQIKKKDYWRECLKMPGSKILVGCPLLGKDLKQKPLLLVYPDAPGVKGKGRNGMGRALASEELKGGKRAKKEESR